jgi:Hydrophobic surface binding protein A
MQLSFLLTLGLCGLSIATPVATFPRDIGTLKNALSSVQSSVDSLNNQIGQLSEKSDLKTEVPKLVLGSNNIIEAIKVGTTAIRGSGDVSLLQAGGLMGPSKDLVNTVRDTINDLKSKKAIIEKAGETAAILASLKAQKLAAKGLVAAIVDKVPSVGKKIAQNQAKKIVEILDDGIKAFGG